MRVGFDRFFRVLIRFQVVVALLVVGVPSEIFAAEEDYQVKQVERQKQEAKMTAELVEQAKEKEFRDKLARIAYSDILADPDNIDLNYKYAQQQVSENNLLGAAATLERILLVNPNLAKIRLFYAVVLFRLDNLNEARFEIEKLEGLEMPDSLRKELNLYKKEINRRQRRYKLELSQAVGWQIDSNRNAAPSSKRRLFFEAPLGLQGPNSKQPDTSFINVTSVNGSLDLGTQAGHELIGSFTYYLGEQTRQDGLDLQSFQYELGGIYKSRFFHFQPTYEQKNIYLSHATFLRTQALNLKASKEFKRASIYSKYKLERQDYQGTPANARAIDRRGRYTEVELGTQIKLTQNQRVNINGGYANKAAKQDFEGYEKLFVGLSHTLVFWKGHFLVNSANASFDYYDEPDITVAGRFRKDKSLRYRTTYGMPLQTIPLLGKWLPSFIGDMTATATFEYYRAVSTITNYTYTNYKLQTLLQKRIRF